MPGLNLQDAVTSRRNGGWQCGIQPIRGGFLWSDGRAWLRELDVSCRGNIGGNVLGDNPEVFDSQANFFIPHDGSKSREGFHSEASTRSTWRRRRQFGSQPYEETAMAQQEDLVVCQDGKFNAVCFPLKNLKEKNPESHGLCFSASQHIGLLSEGGSASILSRPTSGCKVAGEDLPRKLCAHPSLEWDDSWKSLPQRKLQLSWGQGLAEYERSKAECEREDKVHLARECKRKAPATPCEQLDCSGVAAMFDFCEDGQFFKKNKVDSGEAVGAETSKHLREGSESADDHEQFKGLDTFVITRNKVLIELEKVEMCIDQVDKELQRLCEDCLDEHGSDSISKMAQASSVSCVKSLPQNGILPYCNIRLDCVHDRCSQATYLSLQDSFENKEFANSKDNPSNFGFCQAPGLLGTFCTESQGIVMNLLQANKQEAWRGSGLLAHLYYNGADDITEEYQCLTLEDMPCWKRNIDSHEYNKKLLIQQISAQKRASMFKERVLAFKYCAMRQIWKKKQYIVHHQRDYHKRLRIVRSGVEVSDLSLVKSNTLKQLMTTKSQCRLIRMPAMILDGKEKLFRRFLSTNGLICDPAASEQERAFMNPWTPGERRTFYEKFIEFGKNFRQISAYLDHKTSGDCVQFYYRHLKCGLTQMQTRMQRQCSLSCRSDLAAARGTQPPAWNAVTVDPVFENCRTHSGFTYTAQKRTVDSCLKVHADLGSPATTSSVHKNNFQGTAMDASSPCLSSATLPPGSLLKEKHIQQVTGSSPASSKLGELANEYKGLRARFVQQEYARVKDDSVNSLWNDHERLLFTDAVAMLGREFKRISLHVGSKNEGQCQAFFGKACKRLKLDQLSSGELSSVPAFHVNLVDLGSTRNTGNSQCAETRAKNEGVEEPKNKDINQRKDSNMGSMVSKTHQDNRGLSERIKKMHSNSSGMQLTSGTGDFETLSEMEGLCSLKESHEICNQESFAEALNATGGMEVVPVNILQVKSKTCNIEKPESDAVSFVKSGCFVEAFQDLNGGVRKTFQAPTTFSAFTNLSFTPETYGAERVRNPQDGLVSHLSFGVSAKTTSKSAFSSSTEIFQGEKDGDFRNSEPPAVDIMPEKETVLSMAEMPFKPSGKYHLEERKSDQVNPCPGQEQTLVTEIHAGSFSLMKNSCDKEIYGGCHSEISPIAALEHSAVHNSVCPLIDLKLLPHFQGACIESNTHTPDSRSMGAVGSLIRVTSPSQTSAINATNSKLSSADNEGLAMNDSSAGISVAGHFTGSPMSSTAVFQKRSVQPICTVQGLFQRPACSKTSANGLPRQYKAMRDFELSRWHWQQKCLMRRRQLQQQWQYHKQRKQQKHQHQEMTQQNWWWHGLERQRWKHLLHQYWQWQQQMKQPVSLPYVQPHVRNPGGYRQRFPPDRARKNSQNKPIRHSLERKSQLQHHWIKDKICKDQITLAFEQQEKPFLLLQPIEEFQYQCGQTSRQLVDAVTKVQYQISQQNSDSIQEPRKQDLSMAGHPRFSEEELKVSTEPQHQPLSRFQPQLDISQGQSLESCIQNFLVIRKGMAQHQQKQISVFPLNQRHQQGEDDWQLMQNSQAGLKKLLLLYVKINIRPCRVTTVLLEVDDVKSNKSYVEDAIKRLQLERGRQMDWHHLSHSAGQCKEALYGGTFTT